MSSIPKWMNEEEKYIPEKDYEGFITKSLLSVISVLSKFKANGTTELSKSPAPSAPVKLFMALLMIVLASCSRNMFFTYCLLAVLLVHICTLSNDRILRVFAPALGAAFFSAVILIPAVFMGSPHTMLTVSLKVFLSVGLLSLMAATTPWNKITEGLRFYRVPDLMIFTFDITLKYIVILGDICLAMLNALKLRSVGKNKTKKAALSGIMGITFLRSQSMAEEMCGAMACRGFEGEYRKGDRKLLKKTDIIFVCFSLAVVGLFVYL